MKDYRILQRKYAVNTYPDRALTLIKGKGVYLFDHFGKKYLDLMTNYGVNILGHGHPDLVQSLTGQLSRLTTLHNSFNNDVRASAYQKLVQKCSAGLTGVYPASSGAEAVEAALKFAVLATGRKKFISCRNSYHGKTLGALSTSDNPKYCAPFQPLLWEFAHVDYNDLDQLENTLDNGTAAFLVEPVQGEGGLNVPDPGYLKEAKALCEKSGALMILDEIQTGMGRTGYFLASEPEEIDHDILCLGKGLAGGIPVGATLVSESISDKIPRGIHTSTFGGNPLACAGILAVLDLLDEPRLEHIRTTGSYFLQGLQELKSPLITGIKGVGLMLGFEVSNKRDMILRELQKKNVLAIPAAARIVRFLPSYILEKEHVDLALNTLQQVLDTAETPLSPGGN